MVFLSQVASEVAQLATVVPQAQAELEQLKQYTNPPQQQSHKRGGRSQKPDHGLQYVYLCVCSCVTVHLLCLFVLFCIHRTNVFSADRLLSRYMYVCVCMCAHIL